MHVEQIKKNVVLTIGTVDYTGETLTPLIYS